jgi:ribokinase
MGSRGACVLYRGEKIEQEAVRVKAIDTTGAGDSFNAYFNATYLDTGDIKTSLKKAVIAGALKTLRRGSAEAPYRSEVEAYFSRL